MELPQNIHPPGFYYHYKHDPDGTINNYAYEVMGPLHHTEDQDCRPEDIFMMIYRPLYREALAYKMGKLYDGRPFAMFMEDVEIEGVMRPRFVRITDPMIVGALAMIRDEMYPERNYP